MSTCAPENSINPLAPTFFPLRTSEAGPCTFAMSSSMANNSPAQRTPARNNKSVKYLTCYYYLNGGCSKSENDCLYSHFDTGKYAGRPCKVDGGPAIAGRNLESALFERKENWRSGDVQGAGADITTRPGSSLSTGDAMNSISFKAYVPPAARPSNAGLEITQMHQYLRARQALPPPEPSPIDSNVRSLAELVKTSVPDFEGPLYGTCGPVGGPVISKRIGPPQENIFGPIDTTNPTKRGSSPFSRSKDRGDSPLQYVKKAGLNMPYTFPPELLNTPPNRHCSLAERMGPFRMRDSSPQGNNSEHRLAAGTGMPSVSPPSGKGASPKSSMSLSKSNSPKARSNAAIKEDNHGLLHNQISSVTSGLLKARTRLQAYNQVKQPTDPHELTEIQRSLEDLFFETIELHDTVKKIHRETERDK